jgi:ubiquinone biosynthesis protein Coq4
MNQVPTLSAPTVDREFGEELLQTIDDPGKHGVHILFNSFWKYVPDVVRDKYLDVLMSDPEQRAFLEERRFSEPYAFESLADFPEGSLGRAMRQHIIDNGLKQDIAGAYKALHDGFEGKGALDRMPEEIKYSVLRTYQTHDFLHLITGFPTNGLGEIALQAFCLAQHRSPYFAIWVSVVTARMTYLNPEKIEATMDALTEGWALGRQIPNLMIVAWEERLGCSVASLRQEYGIRPEGRRALGA